MANIGLLVLMFLTILIVMGLSLIAILILNGAREPNDIEAINGTTLIERDQVLNYKKIGTDLKAEIFKI